MRKVEILSQTDFWGFEIFSKSDNLWKFPQKYVWNQKVSGIYTFLVYFSNGPDDVGRWQRATFKFFFFFLQGTSIGLAVTNHALL